MSYSDSLRGPSSLRNMAVASPHTETGSCRHVEAIDISCVRKDICVVRVLLENADLFGLPTAVPYCDFI